jgi:hypothetical protein
MYNGSSWQNIRGPACNNASCFAYDGYAGRVTDSVWFTNQRRMTVPASIATVKNDGASGIGWRITGVTACLVTLHMFARYQSSGSGQFGQGAIGFWPGAPTAAMPTASSNRPAFSETDQVFGSEGVGVNTDSSIILFPGESIVVYQSGTAGNPVTLTLSGSVLAL